MERRSALVAGTLRVVPGRSAGRIRLLDGAGAEVATAAAPAELTAGAPPAILDAVNGWAGDHWPGSFTLRRTASGLRLVAGVPLERYLRGVVPSEMPAGWAALPGGSEALEAQAVAARSYALATRHPTADFDAYADTRSQVFGPIEHRAAASDAAVAATAGQVVVYGGAVATTFFSSSSGGRTASMQAAWGSAAGQPYLVPVDDPYDAAGGSNPNHTWAPRAFGPRSLAAALGLARPVQAAEVQVDPASRRARSLTVHGQGGGPALLTAGRVYAALGLRSTFFQLFQLSLRGPGSAAAGARVVLRGRSFPLRGRPQLQADDGRRWRSVAALRPGADGRFTATVRPSATTRYRIVRRHAQPVEIVVRVTR